MASNHTSAPASTNINNPEYWRPEDNDISDKDKLIMKAKRDPFIPIGENNLGSCYLYSYYESFCHFTFLSVLVRDTSTN